MSLLHPPPGFPLLLVPFWPLFWVQVLALRAYVRATYGKGTQYRWSISRHGRVFIVSIDWVPGQETPVWLKPAAHPNDRIAATLDGRAFTPDYVRLQPRLPGACEGKRTHCVRLSEGLGMRGEGVSAGAMLATPAWPLTPAPLPRERGLPRPET